MKSVSSLRGDGKRNVVGKLRISALNKIFADRYGGRESYIFPDDDAGLEDLKLLLDAYDWTNPIKIPRIIALRAPWMDGDAAEGMMSHIEAFPCRYTPKRLGELLRYTGAEWRRLRTRGISPIDMSALERRQDSQMCNRLKVRAERRQAGMKSRTEYLANSLSRTKPWVAEGISRKTWERRRRAQNGVTQVCSNKDYYGNDRLASARLASGSVLDSVSGLTALATGLACRPPLKDGSYTPEPKRPDQHTKAELEEMFARKRRKLPWSTPTLTEIEYTPELRRLYQQQEHQR